MPHIVVTLEYGRDRRDLALPPDVPVRLLTEGLAEALNIKAQPYTLGIKNERGLKPLPANATLGEMDVVHGSVLSLLPDERGSARGTPAARQSSSGAHLQAENGQVFPLSRLAVIGRTDVKSGIFVEIDLGDFVRDPKIISRRHAQIEQQGERYYLLDLGSVNGTKINGQAVAKNQRHLLTDGDQLEFGRKGVRMTFVSKDFS